MSSIYSTEQINQLVDRLEEEGFTSDDITELGQFKDFSDLRGLSRGTHELKQVRHIIDCDANPFCPDGWEVVEHHKGGQLEWDASKVQLYLSEEQKDEDLIEGIKLCKELADKPVFNANVLDYLLKNPHLIPEEWKTKHIFFWGTIYRNSDGRLVVRYFNWYGGEWYWSYSQLNGGFGFLSSAVLLAS